MLISDRIKGWGNSQSDDQPLSSIKMVQSQK